MQFDGTDFHFNLKPHNVRAPNYRAVEPGSGGGEADAASHPVRTSKGTLVGREDTQGRFNLSGNRVEGGIYAPEGWYYVEPLRNYLPSALAGQLVMYRQSDLKPSEDLSKTTRPCRSVWMQTLARLEAQTETDSATNYVFDMATDG